MGTNLNDISIAEEYTGSDYFSFIIVVEFFD